MQYLRHKVNSTGHSDYIESFVLQLLSDLNTGTSGWLFGTCSENTQAENYFRIRKKMQNPDIYLDWLSAVTVVSFLLSPVSFLATNQVWTRGSEQRCNCSLNETNLLKAN